MPAIKQDLYELVTNKVVAALEGGAPPWAPPWRCDGHSMQPVNLATGRAYRGVNVLLLNAEPMKPWAKAAVKPGATRKTGCRPSSRR